MAEFKEVSNDWSRICKRYIRLECFECPLTHCAVCNEPMSKLTHEDWSEAETVITNWAKDHPRPSYPTFGDILVKLGVIQCDRYSDRNNGYYVDYDVLNKPISPELAEQLGIRQEED